MYTAPYDMQPAQNVHPSPEVLGNSTRWVGGEIARCSREMAVFTGGNEMVRLARFERTTACLEGRCSIQLSYRRNLINLNGRRARVQAWLRWNFSNPLPRAHEENGQPCWLSPDYFEKTGRTRSVSSL